ncbi:thioredoxin [Actinophytocola oryzae]|uniref:Thioredoxin n=1 Tax=Actinophytocola oryzae TaxID=502181 RepID=A0A4R7UUY8_9PSEU|nr:thioredoxin [Actinophytocola oryzae]TDV39827.1 thioredoxin [Actinophytocola oryzae]
MESVTEETFDTRVLGRGKPVLVEFWATWCGPCRMVAPVLEQIARERADVEIVKLNYDEEPEVGQRYGVMGLPTMLLFRDGEPVRSFVGARPKSRLLAELDDALRPA